MNEASNAKIVQDIYAAFGRGDVAFILDQLTDDVSWRTHSEAIVPWSGDFSGKARVPKFFDAIYSAGEVTAFEAQDWVVQHDTVVNQGIFGCKPARTGKSSLTRWVFIWKLNNGKVVSYEQFHEPALADAFR